jgi:hypothetical protein
MPLPSWHTAASPFVPNYLAKRNILAADLYPDGNGILDLTGDYRDVDFIDEIHPVPAVAISLTHRLADFVRSADSQQATTHAAETAASLSAQAKAQP